MKRITYTDAAVLLGVSWTRVYQMAGSGVLSTYVANGVKRIIMDRKFQLAMTKRGRVLPDIVLVDDGEAQAGGRCRRHEKKN